MGSNLLSGEPLVLTKENDFLGSLEKVEFLKEFIETELEQGGLLTKENDRMIALYGGRGAGKSSVMQTLHEKKVSIDGKNNPYKLDESKCTTLFFEAWKYEKDDNILHSLLDSILDHVGVKEGLYVKIMKLFEKTKHYGKGLNIQVGTGTLETTCSIAYSMKEVIESIENEEEKNKSKESLYLKIKRLEKEIEGFNFTVNKTLVIFIDDLDRCESENIINLLSAIKLFFTYMPNAVFVVGIDKNAVKLALKRKYSNDEDKAEEYLEKIFTINFSLSSSYHVYSLVQKSLSKFSNPHYESVFNMFEKIQFKNPRHIKKLLNKINIISQFINKSQFDIENDITIFLIFVYYCYLYEFDSKLFEDINTNILESWRNTNYYLKIVNDDGVTKYGPTNIGGGQEHLLMLKNFLPLLLEKKEVVLLHRVPDGANKINNIIESVFKLSFMLGKSGDFLLFLLNSMKDKSLLELQNYDKMCPEILYEVKRIF